MIKELDQQGMIDEFGLDYCTRLMEAVSKEIIKQFELIEYKSPCAAIMCVYPYKELNLYIEGMGEIVVGGHLIVSLSKAILYDDTENVDFVLDKLNQFKDTSKQEGTVLTIDGVVKKED